VFSSEDDIDSLSGLSELACIIGSLASEFENAKRVSHGQLGLLKTQLDDVKSKSYSLIEERDEALRLLSILKEERDQLSLQVGVLRRKLDELEMEQQKDVAARQEAELALLQLRQVQGDLEHYFLLSRQQSEFLAANEDLQARLIALLSNSSG